MKVNLGLGSKSIIVAPPVEKNRQKKVHVPNGGVPGTEVNPRRLRILIDLSSCLIDNLVKKNGRPVLQFYRLEVLME
jgi:hypothetical protein